MHVFSGGRIFFFFLSPTKWRGVRISVVQDFLFVYYSSVSASKMSTFNQNTVCSSSFLDCLHNQRKWISATSNAQTKQQLYHAMKVTGCRRVLDGKHWPFSSETAVHVPCENKHLYTCEVLSTHTVVFLLTLTKWLCCLNVTNCSTSTPCPSAGVMWKWYET